MPSHCPRCKSAPATVDGLVRCSSAECLFHFNYNWAGWPPAIWERMASETKGGEDETKRHERTTPGTERE